MPTIQEYKKLFELYLNENLFKSAPKNLYDPINYILELESKRIRPSLMMAVAEIFDCSVTKVMEPALGIEIFHNFTLIHDDIMDKSLLRRGKPTVDTKYGINAGILSGDVMQFIASEKLRNVAPEHQSEIMALYHKTAIEVCEGQQMDMDFEQETSVHEMEYLQMVTLKTAVLLACSMQIGAIIANASIQDQKNIYGYGMNIGIAFQIQDDLLDTFGEEKLVGKKIGGDICNNKKTLLLIKALQTQHKYDKEILMNWMQTIEFNIQKVADIQRIFIASYAKQYTENKMMYYHDKAVEALDKVTVIRDKKNVLYEFAELIVSRKM